MSNNWNVPKSLAASSELSWREKSVIAVALQYYNAGYPQNVNSEKVKSLLGLKTAAFNKTMGTLSSKHLINVKNGIIGLNHKELLESKLLYPVHYKETPEF